MFSRSINNDASDTSKDTVDAEWRSLINSFKIAESGVFPHHDEFGREYVDGVEGTHKGELIANGYFFVLWLVKGDIEHLQNHYQVPGHWSSDNPCLQCPCTRSIGPSAWTSMGPDSTWTNSLFLSREVWEGHCRLVGKHPNALFQRRVCGGMGLMLFNHHRDELHVMALGIDSHILGNVIWLCIFIDILNDIPRKDRMDVFWQNVCYQYRLRSTLSQFQKMDLTLILEDAASPNASYQFLRGKAAEKRYLAPIVCHFWKETLPGNGAI